MLTEADIREALRVCFDPELQINIVDLGRVHTIHIEPDAEAPGSEPRACVTIELLSNDETQDAMLAAQVTNRLLGLREISRAEVTLLEDLIWTPDRMTAQGRALRSQQQGLVQLNWQT